LEKKYLTLTNLKSLNLFVLRVFTLLRLIYGNGYNCIDIQDWQQRF